MDEAVMKLIESNEPELLGQVRDLKQAVSVVRWLLERENLHPNVVCASADPGSALSFEQCRSTTIVDSNGVRSVAVPGGIYSKEESDARVTALVGITTLAEAGGLAPFASVHELVGSVYSVWQFRLVHSMRRTAETAVRYLTAMHASVVLREASPDEAARRGKEADQLILDLAAAAESFHTIQHGAKPSFADHNKVFKTTMNEEVVDDG